MISVVIRNKTEAEYLKKVLQILVTLYKDDIDEIIVVDNFSTDNSVEIAKSYNCKIITIKNFSYGRAINMGIEASKNNYILLLSAHAIPVGSYFFKSTITFLETKKNIAGIRYVNSFQNYERALENEFKVLEPLKFGLMAACCIIVKDVWKQHKINEDLGFSEDKEWSQRVTDSGFSIYNLNETFFYFINRSKSSLVNRYKQETLANYQLFKTKAPSKAKVVLGLVKKIVFINTKSFIGTAFLDVKKAIATFQIINILNKKGEDEK